MPEDGAGRSNLGLLFPISDDRFSTGTNMELTTDPVGETLEGEKDRSSSHLGAK